MKTTLKISQSENSQTFTLELIGNSYSHTILKGGTKEQAHSMVAACEGMNVVSDGILFVHGLSLLK